ncbi:MAG: aminopeptidase P family protein [Lachnospiraceae bacterium]|nr:aminopeptidase P family protein [Lachnospiraceae bacterium]
MSSKVEEQLQSLRQLMKQRGLAAYIIPTDDFHSSEYVGEYFKAREYMSGFTGSAGTLIVLEEEAALWTDGRYFIQAEDQLRDSSIILMKIGQPEVPTMAEYLRDNLAEGSKIGFDGRCVTEQLVKGIAGQTDAKRITFYGEEDLVDAVWKDRPKLSTEPVWELDVQYAGLGREEKLKKVREQMQEQGADVLLVTALDEIAWLLNLRGNDVRNTPVFLSYMLIEKEQATLCVQEQILSGEILRELEQAQVRTAPYEQIEDLLNKLPDGQTILVDSKRVNYHLLHCIPEGVKKIDAVSPIEWMKAVKTPAEMEHMRAAHVKDGVAVTRFMWWLKTHVGKEEITELGAAAKLETFRAQMEGYLEPSFDPIIAYGAHGAIVHYEPTEETDVRMLAKGLCLADTGGHYIEGTTDITRTIALGEVTEEERKAYTLVLRGHLNLAAARFPYGACGQNLDILAREPLWENGLDFNHGTGHGVGYLLNVHEGPQNFRWRMKDAPYVPLEEGMVISNEPGFYLAGKFGIRHENLMLCRKGEKNEYGQFMYLEPLTMVPFDRDAIDPSFMTDREIALLNDYHKKVYETISPYLEGVELEWLKAATAEL